MSTVGICLRSNRTTRSPLSVRIAPPEALFSANYVFEEGDPGSLAVYPNGDDIVCSLSTGDCKNTIKLDSMQEITHLQLLLLINGHLSLTRSGILSNSSLHASGAGGACGRGTMEFTFIAIKPNGVQRGLIAEIISRFEQKGFKLVAIKIVVPSKQFAQKHYHDLKERPFFNGLCDFLSSSLVIAMVWNGE